MGEGEGIHTHKKGRGSRVRAVIDLHTKQTHTHSPARMLHNWQLNCFPPFKKNNFFQISRPIHRCFKMSYNLFQEKSCV
jgi:hypothetical protein